MKIIKLEQPSCNPCNMVSNYLDGKNVPYERYDVMDNPDVAANYGVMGVPVTILLDDNEKEVKRSIGFKPDELDELISQLNN